MLAAVLTGQAAPAQSRPAAGDTVVIYLVRHAEKLDESRDPPLTEAGLTRAEDLRHRLNSAGITAIWSTDFQRTRATVKPLAGALSLPVTVYDPSRQSEFAGKLLRTQGRHLVVGHSNTIPDLVKALGGEPGTPSEATEYDRLYLVTSIGGRITSSLLRYGAQASQADTARRLVPDPAIRLGTLDNGLRYYVRVNRYPEKRAELRLVVNAGSVLEDDDQRGLAHFVEHMAFNGTARFPKQALVDFIEGVGMRFGAHLNAYTSFDETVFQLQVPTDTARILATAFDILEDWAAGVTFDPEEVERERGVVIEEWRLGQGAEMRMLNRQLPVLFSGSRYADRLPIGDKGTLESFPHEALIRYYREWYRPDLMAVIAIGDFDPDTVTALIRRRFGALARPASPRPRAVVRVPSLDSGRVTVATDPEATNSLVSLLVRVPLRSEGTVGAYRQSLVDGLHDQILNSRLFELIQRPDPPFIGAGAGRGRFVRDARVFSMGALVSDGGIDRGLAAVLREAERVRQHGFTATELERAKQDLARGYEQAWAEREKTPSAAFAEEYGRNYLEGEPIPGIVEEYALVKSLVPGIPLAEVNAAGTEWSASADRVIFANAPEKPGLAAPDPSALLAAMKSVRGTEVAAYVDDVSDEPLVPRPPDPGRVVAESADPRLGTRTWTLSNGARVMLKPTEFKADEVLFTAYSPGGTSLAPDSVALSASLAATLVELGGLGEFDAVALGKKLSGKVAGASAFLSVTQEGLSGRASPKDLATLFELIHLRFTAPRADTGAFQAFVTNARASLANRGSSPEAVFEDTVGVTLAQHHPRMRPLTSDLVDSLDLGAAIRLYQDRFADASDFTFVFVGAFSPDSIRPLVEQWIGGLPAIRRTERWRDLGIRPPTGVVARTVHKGVEPKSQTRLVFTGQFRWNRADRAALRGLAEVLDIRLREELREALGGTYGVDVRATTNRVPREDYAFTIGFGSAPERADELVTVVFREIERLGTEGPRERDLAKVQETEIRGRETRLRENGYWLAQLAAYDESGEDPAPIADPRGAADLFTADAIRNAARRYLDANNYVRVTLLPESGSRQP
jgi:zinc protease